MGFNIVFIPFSTCVTIFGDLVLLTMPQTGNHMATRNGIYYFQHYFYFKSCGHEAGN